jgi:hypothetical protein
LCDRLLTRATRPPICEESLASFTALPPPVCDILRLSGSDTL